jgi:adenine-specific DNA glycosylase
VTRGLPPAADAAEFRKRLAAWFRRHSRDLPWRRTRDPYHVLVSELMLQQTQVSRVVDFYGRFLDRFPDLYTLAKAPPKQVRESWEGLGYYARARNLHTLAQQVTTERAGVIPAEVDELRALPGIGAYTAEARVRTARRPQERQGAEEVVGDRRASATTHRQGGVDAQSGVDGAGRAGVYGAGGAV